MLIKLPAPFPLSMSWFAGSTVFNVECGGGGALVYSSGLYWKLMMSPIQRERERKRESSTTARTIDLRGAEAWHKRGGRESEGGRQSFNVAVWTKGSVDRRRHRKRQRKCSCVCYETSSSIFVFSFLLDPQTDLLIWSDQTRALTERLATS